MKRYGALIVLIVTFSVLAYAAHKIVRYVADEPSKTVELSRRNTLALVDVVTSESVARLQAQLVDMSFNLKQGESINLILYTPGGDVQAGSALIDTIRSLPVPVNTITLFAASMGFHIVQNSPGERMITPSGTLMSHRARGGVEGEFNGSINVRVNHIGDSLNELESRTASRMGLDIQTYRNLIRDEFWATAGIALKRDAADSMVLAKCDKSFSGSYNRDVTTLFGTATLVMSNCPLITTPIEIKLSAQAAKNKNELMDYFDTLYYNPSDFVINYIENQKYKNIVK